MGSLSLWKYIFFNQLSICDLVVNKHIIHFSTTNIKSVKPVSPYNQKGKLCFHKSVYAHPFTLSLQCSGSLKGRRKQEQTLDQWCYVGCLFLQFVFIFFSILILLETEYLVFITCKPLSLIYKKKSLETIQYVFNNS